MKRKSSLQFSMRMMTLVTLLTALPFIVLVLTKKTSNQRELASTTQADVDATILDPAEFKKTFKYVALKDISIESTQKGVGIQFAHFTVKSGNGETHSVCDIYPNLYFIFNAEGMAQSGETPELIVKGPCQMSTNGLSIKALPIPFDEIMKSSAAKNVFSFLLEPEGSMQVYASNIMDTWPTRWNWSGVTFYSENGEDRIEITGYEIISVLGNPLILKAGEK